MNHPHLLTAFMLATLTACAVSTPQPTRMASAARSGAPAAATTAATGASAIPAMDEVRVADSEKRAKEMGYHVEMRDGTRFFCRTVAPMGTRIPQKECLRSDAMQQLIRRTEEDKMNIRQFQSCGPNCVPPPNAQ
jgi:hypothetical protein